MNFCGYCGHKLHRTRVADDSFQRLMCVSCKHIHYDNPKVLVWCFAHWQDQLLLCQRANDPARGLWNPPAGFVESGESLEEAASREMNEEAGLWIPPDAMKLYRVASIPHMNQVYVGFRAELSSRPLLVPGVEVSNARFWKEGELSTGQFAFRDLLDDVPDDFFRCLGQRKFPILAVTVRIADPPLGTHHEQ